MVEKKKEFNEMIPIIVPFYYSYHCIERFVQSMQLENNEEIFLIFIQNSEDDLDGKKLEKQIPSDVRHIQVLPKRNVWFSKSVNFGAEYCNRDEIDKFMIFNPDCFPREENWLSRMLDIWKQIEDKSIVTLGTLQYTDSNKIWHDGTTWKTDEEEKCHELDWRHNNRFIYDILTKDYHKVDGNTGTGIMIDMKKFIGLGMFNAEKYPHYSSDADFCLRATKKGYTHYSCDVTMNHQPGTSVKK